jgi:multisubunit Na+/H+ antiporter MnhC subunit
VKENLEKIIIGIVLLTTGPVLVKLLIGRKKRSLQPAPVYQIVQEESEPKNSKL